MERTLSAVIRAANSKANDSVSSSSSNDSTSELSIIPKIKSRCKLSKQSSKVDKQEKRWKKNKIGKEDFYNKTTEFRTWLFEKKNVQFDSMETPKAKKAFKKFIKKWNNKKLDQKYYNGLGMYWAAASPGAYSHAQDAPVLSADRAQEKLKASSFTPLYHQDFSTFGKKERERALRELNKADGFNTPTRSEEHVYDVPNSETKTEKGKTQTRGKASKPRPALSQLFTRPGEVSIPRLESGVDEPTFATITPHQRPRSCVALINHPPAAPIVPEDKLRKQTSSSSSNSDFENSWQTNLTSDAYQRNKCSNLSIRSTMSVRSSISYRSDHYVSFQPKPPPRSSSISSNTSQLQSVAQAVVSKLDSMLDSESTPSPEKSPTKTSVSDKKEHLAQKTMVPIEEVASPPPPSPPPTPPIMSLKSLSNLANQSFPTPPPGFADLDTTPDESSMPYTSRAPIVVGGPSVNSLLMPNVVNSEAKEKLDINYTNTGDIQHATPAAVSTRKKPGSSPTNEAQKRSLSAKCFEMYSPKKKMALDISYSASYV